MSYETQDFNCPQLGDYHLSTSTGGHQFDGIISSPNGPREWSVCTGCRQEIWRRGVIFAVWRTDIYVIEEDPI